MKYSLEIILSLVLALIYSIAADLITESDLANLAKLRPLISKILLHDKHKSNSYLVRWLRASENDVDVAAEKIKETFKWRRYNRIDTIQNETLFDFKPVPYIIEGRDKEGYPLLLFSPTHVDMRKYIIQGSRDKLVRYYWQMLERGHDAVVAAKLADNLAEKGVAILDLHGYNLKQHFCLECIGVFKEWFIGMEKHYPNALQHFVIVNIPKSAKQLIDIILPLLSPNTHKSLRLFEPNQAVWKKYLLSIIPADQLPFRFGGSKKSDFLAA